SSTLIRRFWSADFHLTTKQEKSGRKRPLFVFVVLQVQLGCLLFLRLTPLERFCAFEHGDSIHAPEQMDQSRDHSRPACLVARAQAGAIITMKIFVEQQVITPVRVGLKFLRAAVDRPSSLFVLQENVCQSIADLPADFKEVHQVTRTGGTLDLEV